MSHQVGLMGLLGSVPAEESVPVAFAWICVCDQIGATQPEDRGLDMAQQPIDNRQEWTALNREIAIGVMLI